MRSYSKLTIILISIVSLLAMVSCGGDGDDNGSNSNQPTPVDSTAPFISKLDAESYSVNSAVKVEGRNFGKTKGSIFCTPNLTISGSTITQWNDTIIRFMVTSEMQSGDMYVIRTDGQKSNTITLTIGSAGGGGETGSSHVDLIAISKGSYTMGNSSVSEASPAHKVTISYDFYIAKTETTQEQYKMITGKNPFQQNVSKAAANYVSFVDACNFCNSLSAREGFTKCYTINGTSIKCNWNATGYRLPTEAEWEYAARANTTTDYGTGIYAWYLVNGNGAQEPKEVATRQPNAWGLYDMQGNVSEWCWDYYSLSYYEECKDGVTDPRGSSSYGGNRAIRGGGIQSDDGDIKVWSRASYNDMGDGSNHIGFRVVRRK